MMPLRYLGDPVLRKKCRPVAAITPEIKRIAKELIETVIAHNGSGLAAPQIGYDLRMFVIQLGEEVDKKGNPYDCEPTVFINPEITRYSKENIKLGEGCLSIPGFYEDILRPKVIDFAAIDIEGNPVVEKNVKNWRARCMQHEVDHLDGILFIDRFPENLKKKHENALKYIEMQYQNGALHKKFF